MPESARQRAINAFWGCFNGWSAWKRHKEVPAGTLRALTDLPALILYVGDDEPVDDDLQELGIRKMRLEVSVAGVRAPSGNVLDDREQLRADIIKAVHSAQAAGPQFGGAIIRLDYAGSAVALSEEPTAPRSIVFVGFMLYYGEDEADPFVTLT